MFNSFKINGNRFELNGKPFQVFSGAIHYFRCVPEYWEDRLLKLKLAGFNTVETYVCWNLHEPVKNEYDFSGMLDIVKYIKTAQQLGLYIIVRPGPYICGEWEFGGLPAWILKDNNVKLRCSDSSFLIHVKDFFTKLFSLLRPLQITNGGNIIAMQIENEYGSYANDKKYLRELVEIYDELGINVLTFTSDGTWCNMLSGGTIDNVLPTLNFGSRTSTAFSALKRYGDIPKMCMEFWCGWFDHWGEKHHTRKSTSIITEIEAFINQNASFNMYMFYGGTNFGFNAGANFKRKYQPVTTSYDYCAPLTEYGDYTETYHKIREILCNKQSIPMLPLPEPPELQNLGKVSLVEYAPLFENLDEISTKYFSPFPEPMEKFGQNYGLIFYKTKIVGEYAPSFLSLKDVHDRAYIYLNNKKIAIIDRCKEHSKIYQLKLKKQLFLKKISEQVDLGILVEAMGRVNYGDNIYDRKGITEVSIANQLVLGYEIYTIPLNNLEKLKFNKIHLKGEVNVPVFFRGTFKAQSKDCFINMTGFTKGYVFVNGFNLGRYWDIGPQKTLYLPGPILKEINEIIVFELEHFKNPSVTIQNKPILG